MGICMDCGAEGPTFRLDGADFCWDCFWERSSEPETIDQHLEEFIEDKFTEFARWVWEGDAYLHPEDKQEIVVKAIREWVKSDPAASDQAKRDFRTSSPGEWQEYLQEESA